jgi:hypothetical protein
MPAFARNKVIDEGAVTISHVWTRCSQLEFLLGRHDGRNFDHRREWLDQLLRYQASLFAVEIGSHNILENHYHLVLRTRPDIVMQWSAEEVAWRYSRAWGRWNGSAWDRQVSDERIEQIVNDPWRVAAARWNLQSLSTFMARINEPISKLANAESGKAGSFWAERFRSRKLEDPAAVLTCLAYVDLNQMRAGMADGYRDSLHAAAMARASEQWEQWTEEQVAASLKAFRQRAKGRQEFTEEQMRALLDCSWLAPITENTPSVPMDFRLSPIAAPGARCGVLIPSPTWALDDAPAKLEKLAAETRADVEKREQAAEEQREKAAEEKQEQAAEEQAAEDGAKKKKKRRKPRREPKRRRFDASRLAEEIARAGEEANDAPADAEDQDEVPASRGPDAPPTFAVHERMLRTLKARASDAAILAMPLDVYLRILGALEAQFKTGRQFDPADARVLTELGVRPADWARAVDQFDTSFGRVVGGIQVIEAMLERLGLNWIKGIQACRDHFT